MSCVNVQLIDPDECIGASLPKINGNFAALSAAVCNLSGSVGFEVVDSPTIDLDWNASTRTLSAAVLTNSIRYSHLASWQTLSGSPTLSAEAVQPRLAKAWVNFNGTTSPGTIRSSYNVSSVTKNGTGDYTVNFATAFADANYSWAAAHNFLSDNAVDCGGRQAPTTTTLRTKITNLTTYIDPQWANIIVFSN